MSGRYPTNSKYSVNDHSCYLIVSLLFFKEKIHNYPPHGGKKVKKEKERERKCISDPDC